MSRALRTLDLFYSPPPSNNPFKMPTKKKGLPIEPSMIIIRHRDKVVEVMSQLDENGKLFVVCPHCNHKVQLSRYGHPKNFEFHYLSKRCTTHKKAALAKELRETLVKKFGPMYGECGRVLVVSPRFTDYDMEKILNIGVWLRTGIWHGSELVLRLLRHCIDCTLDIRAQHTVFFLSAVSPTPNLF